MNKKLKLTKIGLETKEGKGIDLSIDEAKELYDKLHELFGNKYVPSQPIIIERDRWYNPYTNPYTPFWYDTTCKVEGKSGLTASYQCETINN